MENIHTAGESTKENASWNKITLPVLPIQSDPVSYESMTLFTDIIGCLFAVVSVTGITTNIININTFLKMGIEDSVTICFFSMAISDLCVSSLVLVLSVSYLLPIFIREFHLGFHYSPLIFDLFIGGPRSAFVKISVLITTFLAIQRCLCVLFPFHVKGLFTRRRTVWYISFVTVFFMICFALFMWRYYIIEIPYPASNETELILNARPGSEPYIYLIENVLGLFNVACEIVVLLCVVIMFVTLRKSVRFRKSMSDNTKNVNNSSATEAESKKDKTNLKETQALKQVILISTIFVLCNTPYVVFCIANILMPELGINLPYQNLYILGVRSKFAAENINSAVNFFVYYNFNSKYRNLCEIKVCKKVNIN